MTQELAKANNRADEEKAAAQAAETRAAEADKMVQELTKAKRRIDELTAQVTTLGGRIADMQALARKQAERQTDTADDQQGEEDLQVPLAE